MKQKLWVRIASYVLVALLSVAITLAVVLLPGSGAKTEDKLDALRDLIQEKFIGEKDLAKMEDAAAEAMVKALGDRWSYYLSAQEYLLYQDQSKNSYVGIGVTISVREDGKGLDVQSVVPEGPAQQAGILAGDVIVGVDGQSVEGKSLDDISLLIRGLAGTEVTITVKRAGEQKDFPVVRQQFHTPAAVCTLLKNGIGLVTISNFHQKCNEEARAAVKELLDKGATKLIFDLRNNPGGYVDELVPLLDYLLPEGVLFVMEDYNGKTETKMSDASCIDLPMAVLVNGESYSAAEFFAAALSEYEAAVVVGEQTCGKGYFQSTYKLPDGSAVGLSIGKYYTPKNVNLAGVGITPDVTVPVDQNTAAQIVAGTLAPEEDPQIQAAIEALMNE